MTLASLAGEAYFRVQAHMPSLLSIVLVAPHDNKQGVCIFQTKNHAHATHSWRASFDGLDAKNAPIGLPTPCRDLLIDLARLVFATPYSRLICKPFVAATLAPRQHPVLHPYPFHWRKNYPSFSPLNGYLRVFKTLQQPKPGTRTLIIDDVPSAHTRLLHQTRFGECVWLPKCPWELEHFFAYGRVIVTQDHRCLAVARPAGPDDPGHIHLLIHDDPYTPD